MVGDQLHERVDPNSAADFFRNPQSAIGNLRLTWPPHPLEHRLVYKNIGRPGWTSDIDCYLRDGGYEQLKQALTLSRDDIVNKIKNSGLRGRGGAGFSCGLKWSFIKPDEKRPVYLICNADESEPGTFKDRYIIHEDPHQLLEGMLISCYALGAHTAYIYIRGEFPEGAKILEHAIEEARQRNFLGKNILGSGFDVEFYVHRGAGAYICGEETGLIESLEGKRGYPRIKPPYFPAVLGLYMCPTIVNNVETLCNIKHIIAIGGAEYARLGRPNNTGTRVLCVSGDVQRPGYFEVEVGAVTMGQLIYEMAGGLRPGRKLKAVIPGGSSAKVLRADERFKLKEKQPDGPTVERELSIDDIPMDFDSLAAAGSMAGSGGVIVLDDSRDMVWALNNINKFYAHESCGQCTPCREGSLWMQKITDRMLRGGGVVEDPKTLKTIGDNIAGRTICAFGEACAWPTQSFVEKFPEEFSRRAQKPVPPPLPPDAHIRRINRGRIDCHRTHGPRPRLGKSRRERNDLTMSEESRKAGRGLRDSEVTESIIAAAIAVHRELGPGFLESVYEQALAVEFAIRGIAFVRQKAIPLFYRDHQIGEHRLDFVVEDKIVVELKAVEALENVHFAIVRSYLKAAGLSDGLILNFSSMPLTVKRVRRERGFETIDMHL